MRYLSKNILIISVFLFVLLLVGCSNFLDEDNENPEDNTNPTNQKAILDFPEEKLRYEFFDFEMGEVRHTYSYNYTLSMKVEIFNLKDETHTVDFSYSDGVKVYKDGESYDLPFNWSNMFNTIECNNNFIDEDDSIVCTLDIDFTEDTKFRDYGVYEFEFNDQNFFLDLQEKDVTLVDENVESSS